MVEQEVHSQIQEEVQEKTVSPQIKLFHKLAGYYKWTWMDFLATPWWVITELSQLLDEKENDLSQFIGYEEASIYKNLRRLYPSDKS